MTNLSTSVSGEGYDPVCGMLVDEARAKYSAKHNGRKFYFCSGRCKATFDGQPSAYVQGVSGVHWIQSYSVLPKSRDPEIRV
ncbi:MAG: YHS domain-containing protein [Thaumarchaeota archaeon]|nr:YHS domain-containing protein [Nitrososphaerota archaeon]